MLDIARFTLRIRDIDRRYAENPSKRRTHMERIRNEFFAASIAERLRKQCDRQDSSNAGLLEEAEQILRKVGHRTALHDPRARRRTKREELLLNSAKTDWYYLLKSKGIAAARPWGEGKLARAGSVSRLRRLLKLRSDPAAGAIIFRDYVRKHALHFSEICDNAKHINAQFVPPDLERAILQLVSASSER